MEGVEAVQGVDEKDAQEISRDEALSALLDGELAAEQAAELRARMAEEPALAERFARMAELDQALRGLSRRKLSPEHLEQLRAGVMERVASEPSGTRPRRVWRWMPAAAALAAGLALYLAVSGDPATENPVSGRPGDASQQIAETTSQPEPSEPAAGTGAGTGAKTRTGAAGAETAPDDIRLASVSEEELAIGLAYETLADLEVIENLELLELMAALEEEEKKAERPDAVGEQG